MGVDSIIYVLDRKGYVVCMDLDRFYVFEGVRKQIGGYVEQGIPIDDLIAALKHPEKCDWRDVEEKYFYHWIGEALRFLVNVKLISGRKDLYAMITDESESGQVSRHPANDMDRHIWNSVPYSITRFWTEVPPESSPSPV